MGPRVRVLGGKRLQCLLRQGLYWHGQTNHMRGLLVRVGRKRIPVEMYLSKLVTIQ